MRSFGLANAAGNSEGESAASNVTNVTEGHKVTECDDDLCFMHHGEIEDVLESYAQTGC